MISLMKLDNFFNPTSIGIIGASRDPKKIGYGILKNIIDGKYKGKIFPINPNAKEILGYECVARITDLKSPPDLVILSVPAQIILSVMKGAVEFGVKHFVIISAGFKETGEEGLARETELKELIQHNNLSVLGPNCLGFITTEHNLNATFAGTSPEKGKIAFASQSGALCTATLDWAQKTHIGFSYFISLGNEADINEVDLLNLWDSDPNVSSIVLYLEGFRDGKQFYHVAQRVSLKKPVIVMMPGKSQEAKRAISSHTGSIAAEAIVLDAALKQAGVIQAENLEDLFDYMTIFEETKMPLGRNIAIVSNAGGPAILTTDEISRQNLKIAQLSEKTIETLGKSLPRLINLRDPLDLIGDALSTRYDIGLKELLHEDNVDAVVVLLTPQVMTEIEETASVIVRNAKKFNKPVVTAFMGGMNVEHGIRILNEQGIANFYYPERAVKALQKMISYREWKDKNLGRVFFIKQEKEKNGIKDVQKYKTLLGDRRQSATGFIEDKLCLELLKTFNFPIPHFGFAQNPSGVMTMARFIGLPVALKASTPELPHKSDGGFIYTALDNYDKVSRAAKDIADAIENKKITTAWSYLVQKMVPGELEVIIGAKKDPNVGHIILFGAGGIYTELYKDISLRIAPIERKDAEEMIEETNIAKILTGFRGRKVIDKKPIIEILLRLSDLVSLFPEIEELDFNPIIVAESSVSIVDAKIRIA